MKEFFEKYPMAFSEMTAVKMIHKQIEKAQHMLKKDKSDKSYLKELALAMDMLSCFFEEKGVDPSTLL